MCHLPPIWQKPRIAKSQRLHAHRRPDGFHGRTSLTKQARVFDNAGTSPGEVIRLWKKEGLRGIGDAVQPGHARCK